MNCPKFMPADYARERKPRIEKLLTAELPRGIRRQLKAVLYSINDKRVTEITGLDKLDCFLNEWEGCTRMVREYMEMMR